MIEDKPYTLDGKLLAAVLDYLATRPYAEVAALISSVLEAIKADNDAGTSPRAR